MCIKSVNFPLKRIVKLIRPSLEDLPICLPRISRMPLSWRVRWNPGACYIPQRRRRVNRDIFPGKPRSTDSNFLFAQNAPTYGDLAHIVALTYGLMRTGVLQPQLGLLRSSTRLRSVGIHRKGRRLFLLASCGLLILPVDETSTHVGED